MGNHLPKNWVECDLFDIANVITGKKDANHSTDDGQYIFFTCAFEPLKSPDYSFEDEVLILPGNGANVGHVFYYSGKFQAYQRTYIIEKIQIQPKYLYYHLLAFWRNRNENEQYGTATNYIKIGNFKSYQVDFPPLPEQNRIVAKLDQLFSQLETIKASMANIPLLIKDFRQQVLTQAVTGKLTERWRVGKNLKEWQHKKVTEITLKVGSGSTPTGGQAAYLDSGIPLIRSMNVHFNGIKYDGLAFLNENQAKGLKNVEVFENDILLNITGASIGRVCLAPKKLSGARVNQHVCIIRVNNELKPSFLNIYLSSPIVQNIINNENYGVTRQSFTKAQILDLEIPMPTIDEQEIILKKVESLFAKADALEQQYKSLRNKIDNLPHAFLNKAFKGELVEQLEIDGDARELLKEIASLKNATAKTTKINKEKAS